MPAAVKWKTDFGKGVVITNFEKRGWKVGPPPSLLNSPEFTFHNQPHDPAFNHSSAVLKYGVIVDSHPPSLLHPCDSAPFLLTTTTK